MERYKLGKTSIKMPTGWQEIPFDKGLKIIEGDLDSIQAIALLTNKTEKEIRQATDAETIYYFASAFSYLSELPTKLNEFPKSIQLGVDKILFPFVSYYDEFDLAKAEVGQVEDMQAILIKMSSEFTDGEERVLTTKEIIKICPYIVALYIYRFLHSEYDGEKALLMVDRVKTELSTKEVLSMGYFFLKRLPGLMSGQTARWRKYNSLPQRLKRALLNLMQRLVSMLPSTS